MATSLNYSGAGVGTFHESLPRLAQETELQKMLADEKIRSEQHKTNYQTLKTEHTRLQDEYMGIQSELKSTIEESKLVQEKYKGLLEQLRKELTSKHQECENMKGQVLTDQKKEMLKLQLVEDMEGPFRSKMARMQEEADTYRAELNKLKYEYAFLKTEYEHEKQQHKQITEETKLRHEAEVTNLRKEREMIVAKQQTEGGTDGQRVRVLQRENAQLHLKVKGVLTELDEIRAQREHLGLQSDHVSRLQSKQLAEHQANIKALETERQSLKLQCDNLQKEMLNTTELHTRLTSRVHELEKDNIVLKNRADEVTHKSKVELTNLKMSMLKERGELERERDKLRNQLEELKSQLDIQQHSMDQQAAAIIEAERTAVKKVQAAHEEEWAKLHQVENEKLELETKLQEMERRKIDEETHKQMQKEQMEEEMKRQSEARETAEREVLVAKAKLQHQQALSENLERERSENADLKIKLHRVETEFNSYVSNEQELLEMNHKLKSQVDNMQEEVRCSRDELSRGRNTVEKTVATYRAGWAEEKLVLQKRVDELEAQTSQLHNKLGLFTTTHKKKKKKYVKVTTKMKDRIQLLSAKLEELSIERDALRKFVDPETHKKLKNQMSDIIRRHQEFRSIMKSGNMNEIPIGELSFASVTMQPCDKATANWTFLENERHVKDLEHLKERLDMLDDNQSQQLRDLRKFTKSVSPIPKDFQDLDLDPERDTESEKEFTEKDLET